MIQFSKKHTQLLIGCVCFLILCIMVYITPRLLSTHYVDSIATENLATTTGAGSAVTENTIVPEYVTTPEQVKGIYMTSWTASTPSLRNKLINLIDTTELNTIVIDIKDYSGKIVFPVTNPKLKEYGSEEVRVKDMRDFIAELHKKNIYVIGRVAVFQDEYFVKYRPDLAVRNADGTRVWADRKGISWIDAGSREYWEYIALVAEESHKIGFDEINFDYIRFPSDGDMKNISYPFSSTTPKTVVLKDFFNFLHSRFVAGNTDPKRLKISADLFGMVTTAQDDMGIGQLLENTIPYFDFVMPMVYPSHYPPRFQNFANPEAYPYEVVKYAMQTGVNRVVTASTTPQVLRPWLQDFGLKMTYGKDEVRAQIQATYDVGLTSWILWSASNKYTAGALETE